MVTTSGVKSLAQVKETSIQLKVKSRSLFKQRLFSIETVIKPRPLDLQLGTEKNGRGYQHNCHAENTAYLHDSHVDHEIVMKIMRFINKLPAGRSFG